MKSTYSKDKAARATQQRRRWTLEETQEAYVLYLEFLEAQQAGVRYVKAPLVRELALELNRSTGSVEAKMMNFSGVRQANHMEWVKGYKPLSNFARADRLVVMGE